MNTSLKQSGRARLKGVVCLVAVLPVMLGGASGLVLCFDGDGHIAIEIAHDDPCGSHRDTGHGKVPPPAGSPGTVALDYGCFDVPISMPGPLQQVYYHSLSGDGGGREGIPQPVRLLHGFVDTASGHEAVRGAVLRSPLPIRHSLLEHRTTVLLI
ncbi:MAG TPA: hypothetical protein VMX58_01055 [Patescibacteria group bacterium]|nr:hypothetical protein [Patescibacteria group bacterium]